MLSMIIIITALSAVSIIIGILFTIISMIIHMVDTFNFDIIVQPNHKIIIGKIRS